jgi:hypothetical protein
VSALLLFIVGVIYLGVALDNALMDNFGMAVVFVAYAVANIGFIMAMR